MRKNNRPTGVFKTGNEYQNLINPLFYEKCPKAVFAAIAVSYMVNHGIVQMDEVTVALLDEWKVLHGNEIVPQKAPNL